MSKFGTIQQFQGSVTGTYLNAPADAGSDPSNPAVLPGVWMNNYPVQILGGMQNVTAIVSASTMKFANNRSTTTVRIQISCFPTLVGQMSARVNMATFMAANPGAFVPTPSWQNEFGSFSSYYLGRQHTTLCSVAMSSPQVFDFTVTNTDGALGQHVMQCQFQLYA